VLPVTGLDRSSTTARYKEAIDSRAIKSDEVSTLGISGKLYVLQHAEHKLTSVSVQSC
jgi:hypothetical protein